MPAFFVHSVPETHRLGRPVIDRLGQKDIVAVDPPGFSSAVPDGFGASQEAYVDWLIARIEAIGEPVDLVAHDWRAIMIATRGIPAARLGTALGGRRRSRLTIRGILWRGSGRLNAKAKRISPTSTALR